MQKYQSISLSISRLLFSVMLTVTVIYSTFILVYSWIIEDNIFNRQVIDEASYIQQEYAKSGQVISPRPFYMNLHHDWQGLPSEFKTEYQQNPDKVEYELSDGTTVHIQVFELGLNTYVLTANVAQYEVSRDFLPTVIIWLIGFSLLCCIVVVLIGLKKAKKVTQPLNQLASQLTDDLAVEDVNIEGQYPNNEIGFLAEKIKNTIERLTQALSREANFTKDISHEIRTPVAIGKNILSKSKEVISNKEWKQLVAANLRIEKITETLIALARNESTETTQCNITALLEECLLTNSDVNHTEKGKAIKFDVESEEDIFRQVNPNLVSILLNNILSNIVHYTSGDKVSILLSRGSIRFENSYQLAIPNEPLKAGSKGVTSQGLGQGLSLIKRIAELYEWNVRVQTTDQAFVLVIEL